MISTLSAVGRTKDILMLLQHAHKERVQPDEIMYSVCLQAVRLDHSALSDFRRLLLAKTEARVAHARAQWQREEEASFSSVPSQDAQVRALALTRSLNPPDDWGKGRRGLGGGREGEALSDEQLEHLLRKADKALARLSSHPEGPSRIPGEREGEASLEEGARRRYANLVWARATRLRKFAQGAGSAMPWSPEAGDMLAGGLAGALEGGPGKDGGEGPGEETHTRSWNWGGHKTLTSLKLTARAGSSDWKLHRVGSSGRRGARGTESAGGARGTEGAGGARGAWGQRASRSGGKDGKKADAGGHYEAHEMRLTRFSESRASRPPSWSGNHSTIGDRFRTRAAQHVNASLALNARRHAVLPKPALGEDTGGSRVSGGGGFSSSSTSSSSITSDEGEEDLPPHLRNMRRRIKRAGGSSVAADGLRPPLNQDAGAPRPSPAAASTSDISSGALSSPSPSCVRKEGRLPPHLEGLRRRVPRHLR